MQDVVGLGGSAGSIDALKTFFSYMPEDSGLAFVVVLHLSPKYESSLEVDCMGFNSIGLRAAVEMCGVDRVVFGSDYGPIPYGIEEHVQIVDDVLPSPAERLLVFWRTSNRVFRLGLTDTDLVTEDLRLPSQDRRSPISAVA